MCGDRQLNLSVLPPRQNFTIALKSFALSEAPPTRAPSTFGFSIRPAIVSGFTLPPYWMRIFSAASLLNTSATVARMAAQTSSACSKVAVLPVPIAQIGS